MRGAIEQNSVFAFVNRKPLKLSVVKKEKGTDPVDLDFLVRQVGWQDDDVDFDFNKLLSSFGICSQNPISVEMLSKHSLPCIFANCPVVVEGSTKLTEVQFLTQIPPLLSYIPPRNLNEIEEFKDSTPQKTSLNMPQERPTPKRPATNSPYRVVPPMSQANDWKEFKQEVLGRRPDNQAPCYEAYRFPTGNEVASELELQCIFYFNILQPLQDLFKDHRFGAPEAVHMKGKPDFICRLGKTNSLLMAIEIKTRWVLPGNTNLVEEYNQPLTQAVVRSVEQIYGYLVLNHLRYGILSTYDITWFIARMT